MTKMGFLPVLLVACCVASASEENSSDKDSDQAIVAAAERLVSEAKEAKEAKGIKEVEGKQAGESKPAESNRAVTSGLSPRADETVPSETSRSETSHKTSTPERYGGGILLRLLAGMVALSILAGGLIYAGRQWTRQKNKGGERTRIELLHQFHLGPKRSVALIRVAGEALLIGCTDQAVNMLKTVTLIDDELGDSMTNGFNNFLEDDFSGENVQSFLQDKSQGRG